MTWYDLGFFSFFYGLSRTTSNGIAAQFKGTESEAVQRGSTAARSTRTRTRTSRTRDGEQRVRRGGRQGSVRDVDLSSRLPWASRTGRLPSPWPGTAADLPELTAKPLPGRPMAPGHAAAGCSPQSCCSVFCAGLPADAAGARRATCLSLLCFALPACLRRAGIRIMCVPSRPPAC